MDSKNVLIAVILSTIVLIVWAILFEPPQIEQKVTEKIVTKNEESLSTPSLEKVKLSES